MFMHKTENGHKPEIACRARGRQNAGVDQDADPAGEPPIAERAYRALREAIVGGAFEPGAHDGLAQRAIGALGDRKLRRVVDVWIHAAILPLRTGRSFRVCAHSMFCAQT